MYKKVLLDTTLVAPLGEHSPYIELSLSACAVLGAALGLDDWTYLLIQGESCAEIVRVDSILDNRVGVARAVEDTLRQSFDTGSRVSYTLTAAEILQNITLSPLILNTLGAVGMPQNGVLNVPAPALVGLGGVSDGFPIRRRAPTGCCPSDSAPAIPYNYLSLRTVSGGGYRTTDDGRIRLPR